MKSDAERPEELIPLTPPVFHILMALADGEMHGYAIIQEVDRRTDGQVRLGSGTLYAAIKRLLASRLIEECQERPAPEADDERRRYYRIAGFGLQVAEAEAQRLAQLVRLAGEKKLLTRLPSILETRGESK